MFSYGLDFGTYRSIMAEKRLGQPTPVKAEYTLSNRDGIPSLFWSDGYDQFSCDQVIEQNLMEKDPQGVCTSIKIHLGEDKIVLNGQNYTPEEIMQSIIRRIYSLSCTSSDKRAFLGSPNLSDRIVVGVPLLFGSSMRFIYKSAIKNGININSGRDIKNPIREVILVPESTLAAIAVKKALENDKKGPLVKENILVCDFGAGTFDCDFLTTNTDISKYPYPYISHNASGCFEAGDKFDEKMIELIMQKLEKNSGFPLTTFKKKTHHDYFVLKDQARFAKEHLSEHESSTIIVRLSEDRRVSATVRIFRKEYEQAIKPLVMKSMRVIRRTIEYTLAEICSDVDCSNFDFDVFLVGGSSVIPLIKNCMNNMLDLLCNKWNFPKPDVYLKYPSEAVAFGAAIYAEDPGIIEPRISFAYGLKSFDQYGNQDAVQIVIPSGRGANSKVSESFIYETRYDNQTKIKFPIYEIGNDIIESHQKGAVIPFRKGKNSILNEKKYSVTYNFEKSVSKGTPVKLVLELDADNTLTVKAGSYKKTTAGYVFDESSVQIFRRDYSQ